MNISLFNSQCCIDLYIKDYYADFSRRVNMNLDLVNKFQHKFR